MILIIYNIILYLRFNIYYIIYNFFKYFNIFNNYIYIIYIIILYTSNLQQSWGAEVSKRERDYRKEWCVVDFCTRHAYASVERHCSECTNSTNQAGISISHYFSLEIYSSQHFSLGISTSEYFSLEISSEEETNPFLLTFLLKSLFSLNFPIEISTFSERSYWNLYFLSTFLLKSLLSLYFSIEISTFSWLSY